MIKKNYLWIWGLWLIDISLFITILLIPKEELLYKIFFYIFLLCLFIFPLLITSLAFYSYQKGFDAKQLKIMASPIGLSILNTLMTQIFFVKSLVSEKRTLLIVSSLLVSLFLLGLGAFLKLKKLDSKKVLIVLVFTFILYFAYLFYCIDLSYNYSILW